MDLQWFFCCCCLASVCWGFCSLHSLCFSLLQSPGNNTSTNSSVSSLHRATKFPSPARTSAPAPHPEVPRTLPPIHSPPPPTRPTPWPRRDPHRRPALGETPHRRPAVQAIPTAAMPARRPPSPPCPTGDPYRRAALQAIPTAAMPARRPPSPPSPPGDPYRRAALQAIPTTALLSRSSPPPPPREIPAAALPSRKMRDSRKISVEKQHNLEGYYLLEDAEGYLFQEADGGYYFFPCFKGEGFYYHSEESEYFHAGESLYEKEYGLEALDSELQGLSFGADYSGKVGEGLHHHGDFDKLGLHHHSDFDKLGLHHHVDFDKLSLHGEFNKLGLSITTATLTSWASITMATLTSWASITMATSRSWASTLTSWSIIFMRLKLLSRLQRWTYISLTLSWRITMTAESTRAYSPGLLHS
nr:uncharacterized protein LOC120966632 [Aegilops tauschii subsp. strangulata]